MCIPVYLNIFPEGVEEFLGSSISQEMDQLVYF